MITTFAELIENVKSKPKKTIAVAMAESEEVLKAVAHAYQEGIAEAVLVGNKRKIVEIAQEYEIDISHFDIVNTTSESQSVVRAIQLIREHLADVLMKGVCSTSTLLKGVLDREVGIRSGKLLSHISLFEIPAYGHFLMMSDGGMNIAPDLEAKIAITENAVQTMRKLGVRKPKVAIIGAVERVNYPAMPCTLDAAALSKMAERGQIANCIIDGPLALDNAVSKRACEIKGIKSPLEGDADILIMPNIEAGNVFHKALTYFVDCKSAGIVVGANVPIVVTSRADDDENKFNSIALAMWIS
ncbi:MAG: bifunctional enoyl-CoA hydratase/phosphate acetyltransferase [candidate division KSB1 bacterium]|nr:bifunctional enoyl-CoA hydratase/phosphate acetyltransferase [candidate division KSB1 bacterium]